MNLVITKHEFGHGRRKMMKIPEVELQRENVICSSESNRTGREQRCGQDPENETREIL
jgi:hypothetical protein